MLLPSKCSSIHLRYLLIWISLFLYSICGIPDYLSYIHFRTILICRVGTSVAAVSNALSRSNWEFVAHVFVGCFNTYAIKHLIEVPCLNTISLERHQSLIHQNVLYIFFSDTDLNT